MNDARVGRIVRRSAVAALAAVAVVLGALSASSLAAPDARPGKPTASRSASASRTATITPTPTRTPAPTSTPTPTPEPTPAPETSPSPAATAAPTASTTVGDPVTGVATYYTAAGPAGACMPLTFPADGFTAAAGPALFDDGRACGSWVEVTGARGTVLVKIDNLCPECEPGHLDLSTEAFAAIDDPVKGVVPIVSRTVRNPPLTGGLAFKVKDGSSQWWLGLHVDDVGNAVASVEVADGEGEFRALTRQFWGWTLESSPGAGPYRVRVTDVHGQSAVAAGITLSPGVLQPTTVRLY